MILLIDVDSKIPNLALMKISGFYKAQGHDVKLWRFGYSGYINESKGRKTIDAKKYDMVFVSAIFRCNRDITKIINCNNIEYGGSGYDVLKKLPQEIDDMPPDYTIYPENNASYGFITRGCVRKCSFCIVPEKEGNIYQYREPEQIIKHARVVFLDNNILAYYQHKKILKWLIDKGVKCSFNQGLDVRFIDDENAILLSKLNYSPDTYTFAFDNISNMSIINRKIVILNKYIKAWKIRFYIYCNTEMNIKTEIIPRIQWCKNNQCLPYLMRDVDCYLSNNSRFYSDLAAWCNQPAFFKNIPFEKFMEKRTKNIKTQKKNIELYGHINA